MKIGTVWFITFCVSACFAIYVVIAKKIKDELNDKIKHISTLYETLKEQSLLKIQELKKQISTKESELELLNTKNRVLSNAIISLQAILKEKSKGFPTLAHAWADYLHLQELKVAEYLEKKPHPALKSAEIVKQSASKRRSAELQLRILSYQIQLYEHIAPWLSEFREVQEDNDNASEQKQKVEEEENFDAAKVYLSEHEYVSLTTTEKFQRALERYKSRRKSKWEIGREYERYVGYSYEKDGWDVSYYGILKGFEDLGRDIIAKREGITHIIQCKCWAKEKIIHERHVFQLFGTAVEYAISIAQSATQGTLLQHSQFTWESFGVKPIFITSTRLSDKAKRFAEILGISIRENVALGDYPLVKCNISQGTGERIYHLPFDQQYDKIKINTTRGECCVDTVGEAEKKGFRRAYRWTGN